MVDDSIVMVRHYDASGAKIALRDAMRSEMPIAWKPFPSYLGRRQAWEEWWSPSWIQRGGELFEVFDVPEVEAATTGRDGRLYLIRNTYAEWSAGRNRYLTTQGMWRVRERVLEVRSQDGTLLSIFRIPVDYAAWIRVDDFGRVILPAESGSVAVYAWRANQTSRCGIADESRRVQSD